MKTEYLNRTATLNAESLDLLTRTAAEEIALRPEVDLIGTVQLALASRIMAMALGREMFGIPGSAVTIRGEDFTTGEMAVLRCLSEKSISEEAGGADFGAQCSLLGTTALLLLTLENKLFDTDHTKNEKENETHGTEP